MAEASGTRVCQRRFIKSACENTAAVTATVAIGIAVAIARTAPSVAMSIITVSA